MQKILISACLLGEKVRYHGGDAKIENELLARWQMEGRLIVLCPEMAAGMPAPRPPSEIIGKGGGGAVLKKMAVIKNNQGQDVTATYTLGAQMALALAIQHNIKIAILKDGSPSCGSTQIYDGTFTGKKILEMGITTILLSQNGIQIFNESQIHEVVPLLSSIR